MPFICISLKSTANLMYNLHIISIFTACLIVRLIIQLILCKYSLKLPGNAETLSGVLYDAGRAYWSLKQENKTTERLGYEIDLHKKVKI